MIRGSAGGQVMAIRQRQDAILRYTLDPSICFQCGAIIPLNGRKVSTVRKNKFCSQSCAAIYNNTNRPRKPRKVKHCIRCDNVAATRPNGNWNKLCIKCWQQEQDRVGLTKKSESTHSKIRRHARYVMMKNDIQQICECGYDKHVECCHVKSIQTFSGDTILNEINDLSNLKWLCPNCHWEFDHNL